MTSQGFLDTSTMKTIAIILAAASLTSCWPPPVAIAVQGQYGTK